MRGASRRQRSTLSWDAPSKTGGPGTNTDITGYKIEASPNGLSGWTDVTAHTGSTDTTYSHHGLTASTMRYYRVSAINGVGTGTASGKALGTTRSVATSTFRPRENFDGSLTIWEAEMTAARASCSAARTRASGTKREISGNADDGSLSPLTFTHDDNSWTVTSSVPS